MKIKNKKLIPFGIGIVAVLALVGTVGALSGWFGGAANIVPEDTMTRGLVGYWGMDEGAGTTTADISGNSNTGVFLTAAASPQWAKGKVGGALSFDGSNDYVDAGSNSILEITGDISVEYWVKADSLVGDYVVIFSRGATDIDGYRVTISGTGRIYLAFDTSTGHQHIYSGAGEITTGSWYHVVVTRINGVGHIYKNGAELSGVTSEAAKTPSPSSRSAKIGIYDDGASYAFDGIIDDLKIYNRSLSAEEVRYHYNRGGPVGWWKFDEGASTTAYDSSGNGNTGTLTNMNITTATSSWVTGKYGTALNFDGLNDYVNTPITSAAYTAATQEAWIKTDVGGGQGRIVSKGGGRFSLQRYDVNTIIWQLTTAGGNLGASLSASFQESVWTHVAATYDGVTAKLYINGELKKSMGGVSGAIEDVGDNLSIGADSGGNVAFRGLIDDVRLYNYARTAEEIRLDYNAGFSALFGPQGSCELDPGSCMTKGLVGYWGMEEGAGTTTADISGSGNTAVALTAAATPQWAKGKVGGALRFDGSDDYVDAGTNLWNYSQGTIEFWVNFTSGYILGFNTGDATFLRVANNVVTLRINDEPSPFRWTTTVTGISAGVWAHMVIVQNGVEPKIYVNGVDIGATINGNAKGAWTNVLGSQNFYIGQQYSVFNGLLDEVRIYNRALSAQEIRYHYNRGGPVGWWKLDEGASTTAFDSSGNGNTGTLTNMNVTTATSSWVTGKYGTALNFDGVNDYVSVPDVDILDITNAITISAWVKADTLTSSGDGIVYKPNVWGLDIKSDGAIRSAFYTSGNGQLDAYDSDAGEVVTGTWFYVAVTYNGANVKIYKNGVQVKSFILTGTIQTSANALKIGEEVTSTYNFNGLIDDVRIYNYARTPDEIRLDYNAGFAALFGPQGSCELDPGSCMTKGLVGYWGMEEGTGTTTADISGSGNTAVALTAAATPQWAKGKVGGALRFDGTDDYINVAHNSSLSPSAISVEAWVKLDAVGRTHIIVNKYQDDNNQYGLYVNNTNTFRFVVGNGTTLVILASTDTASAGVWYHMTGTFDGSTAKIYVNGVEKDTDLISGLSAGTGVLGIGSSPANPGYPQGLIDEVRIYNRALSAEEIRYHYNRGGPAAWWKLNEGASTTAYDSSGLGNTGTLQNNMATTSWAKGKYGSALLFDGVNDYVSTPITSLSTWGQLTYEAWINWSGGTGCQRIIDKGGGRASLNINCYTNLTWEVTNSSGFGQHVVASIPPTNTWTHLAGTYDGSAMKLYVNGVVVGSKDQSGTIQDTGDNLLIGATSGGSSGFFSGLLDDVRIYNYGRSAAQILQDYNQGLSAYFK